MEVCLFIAFNITSWRFCKFPFITLFHDKCDCETKQILLLHKVKKAWRELKQSSSTTYWNNDWFYMTNEGEPDYTSVGYLQQNSWADFSSWVRWFKDIVLSIHLPRYIRSKTRHPRTFLMLAISKTNPICLVIEAVWSRSRCCQTLGQPRQLDQTVPSKNSFWCSSHTVIV